MSTAAQHRVQNIAHRGASALAPENTLAAIRKAIEIGVDMIEIDVRQSLDHEVVVMHDRSLKRTTNGHGKVRKKTLAELQKLDAGSWFAPEFANERIPTLEEVLTTVKGHCGLLIEVKDGHKRSPWFAKRLVTLIRQFDAYDWVVVQSFNNAILQAIHRLDSRITLNKLVVYTLPGIPVYYDVGFKLGNVVRDETTKALNPNQRYLSKQLLQRLRASNRQTFCWTVDDVPTMKKLITMGVDGIITNHPDRLKQVLNQQKTHP